jgi:REP element-mobilizing transposase RayT
MKIRAHLLWATKYRRDVIEPQWRIALFEKLASILPQSDARVLCVGGVRNHVHLLIGWRPSVALSSARDLKTWSSRWVRQTIPGQSSFGWQNGFSAFTVDSRDQSRRIHYILNQERHHGDYSCVGGWVSRRAAPASESCHAAIIAAGDLCRGQARGAPRQCE